MTDLAAKKTAIYARFSSQQQRESSLEDQVRQCRAFVEAHGGRVSRELVFEDAAISGASLKRPAFERLMAAVNDGRVDVIVTEDVSRVSRDLADAASVFKRLQYLGVSLIGVADGIDTSAGHAKMSFTLKSLMSEMYLDDLRFKTLRGLEGRAHAGFSTGGLPIGYRSEPVTDGYGKTIGHKVMKDDGGATTVQRVFRLYLDGLSLSNIARLLNAEHVLPPRARTRHRRKGWVASTIRDMLHNTAYIGEWSFKKREWRKVPGTNCRRYRARPERDVIRKTYPDRQIIDRRTWDAVQARLEAVRRCYTKHRGDKPVQTGRNNHYLLSGVLVCADCGASMVISGGSSAKYYRCGDSKKRGTCRNAKLLREDVARTRILETIRQRYASPKAVDYLRQSIARQLGAASRRASAEVEERQARLARTEERIAGLISFISDGDRSDYVRSALKDLEAQAKTEKAALAALRARGTKPIVIPSPDVIIARYAKLETLAVADPLRAREAVKRLFEGGRLKAVPHAKGYLARGRFDLCAVFDIDLNDRTPQTPKAPLSQGFQGLDALSSHCCAGRI